MLVCFTAKMLNFLSSQCAYGEFPLSFAASIGKGPVCEALYRHAKLKGCTSIVRNRDTFGNTAVHMAVKHQQLPTLEWLLSLDEGRECLEITNDEGLTPLTLAARYGLIDIYKHILYNHLSRVAWVFGKVRQSPCQPYKLKMNMRRARPCPGHVPTHEHAHKFELACECACAYSLLTQPHRAMADRILFAHAIVSCLHLHNVCVCLCNVRARTHARLLMMSR